MEKKLYRIGGHSWALIVPKEFVRRHELDTNPRPVHLSEFAGRLVINAQ